MKLQGCICNILLILVVCSGEEWTKHCPTACTCHESHFSELPLYQWLQDKPTNEQTPVHYNNNVMYEDELPPLDENTVLKMAMCVFQLGTEPQVLLSQLSPQIQALVILQGRDSGEIALEAEHVSPFQQLQTLEIHGFFHESVPEHSKLVLRNDALRPLVSLRYLNLEHVKLLGHPDQGNRAPPAAVPVDPVSNEIPVNLDLQGYGLKMHRLVFLPPSDGEGDILPYKVYVEQQEKAGLSTFTGLTNLLFIRVYKCGMKEIYWEMFDGLNNLNYLSLEGNQLLFIPDFAFLGAPNLQTLSLANNQLLSLQSTSLAGLFELEKLDLSSNNFSHLSELSLPPFPKLRIADFRNNPIESIFASTFEIMNGTSTLFIGGEESAVSIQPNSFLGLVNLKELSILNVAIPILERELLRGMPKLRELYMTGVINIISFDAFVDVPKLQNLVLRNCSIRSISMDAFYALYGLLYLDLSNNLLESLPPGLFDQQFSLKELLLQNNSLTRLPPGFLINVPAKMVRLEGNPWHCSCAMKDWQPAVINKVKQTGASDFCQFRYDKGSMCNKTTSNKYIYDKRVAPKCMTPNKFKNWNVFQVLRKELKCNGKQHYKIDRKAYLKNKYENYERSIQPSNRRMFRYYPYRPIKTNEGSKGMNNTSTSATDSNKTFTALPPTSKMNITLDQAVSNTKTSETVGNMTTKVTKPVILEASTTQTVSPINTITDTVKQDLENPTNSSIYTTTTSTQTPTNTSTTSSTNSKQNSTFTTVTPAINSTQTSTNSKQNSTFTTVTPVINSTQASIHTTTPTIANPKKIKQKADMFQEMRGNSITENGVPMKVSKKAWKLEMERKRQEKLRRYQNQISNTI